MVLLTEETADVSVQPDRLARLASLGVTSVALLRDSESVAVVLEGWAFDPALSAAEAARAVTGAGGAARTFHPLVQMAVTTAPFEGGLDAEEADRAPAPHARRGARDARAR